MKEEDKSPHHKKPVFRSSKPETNINFEDIGDSPDDPNVQAYLKTLKEFQIRFPNKTPRSQEPTRQPPLKARPGKPKPPGSNAQ